MSKLFISHSSRDNAAAVAIRDWLSQAGWDDVFLDVDAVRGISAGERWRQALNQAAHRCEVVLILVSRAWLGSEECRRELVFADKLNKVLVCALIEDVSLSEVPTLVTSTWQVVNLATGRDHEMLYVELPGSLERQAVTFSRGGLARLKLGLAKAGLDPSFFVWPPRDDPKRPPYPGLRPLEAQDAGIFFGREAQTLEALDQLRALRDAPAPRFLCILGASGSGKSSFLRAGLWPRLTRDDQTFLPLPVLRPERAALSGKAGLAAVLEQACAMAGLTLTRAEIRAAITGGASTLRPLLTTLVSQAASRLDTEEAEPAPARMPLLVLAIDQGEELFRTEGRDEAEVLLSLLRDLMASDEPALAVLLTIRSDAFERLQLAPALEGLAVRTMTFGPMPRGVYATVIDGPAARMREADRALQIDPALTRALLDDMEAGGGRDALPLLAFTLERLWLDYGARGQLALSDYEALGRIRGSIEAAVEAALEKADGDTRLPQDRAARLALMRRGLIPWLAGIDPDGGAPRRRVARRAEIPEEARPLVDLLVEVRLLSSDIDPKTGEATVEPAHEALLRQWGLLQGWLEEDFAALATLEGVERATRDWEANACNTAWLAHNGERLTEAQKLSARPDLAGQLGKPEWDYLKACRTRVDQEVTAERARARLRRILQWGSLAAALTLAILAGWAWLQRQDALAFGGEVLVQKARAEKQTEEAEAATSRAKSERDRADTKASEARSNEVAALSALSSAVLLMNPARATKLALAAWPRNAHGPLPQSHTALSALGTAVLALRERREFLGHTRALNSAVFSPDGTRVLTTSWDHTARLWDTATGQPLATLKEHTDSVTSAVFSPDGTRILTVSNDATARLWDAATGQPLAIFQGNSTAVFSPDGTRILTASRVDHIARLWDAATGQPLAIFQGNTEGVNTAAFSPDGTRILTTYLSAYSRDYTARLWDAATGQPLATLKGHTDSMESAGFSPDGTRILTASHDTTARLWDAATGQPLATLKGHTSSVTRAVFSPDGTRVLTTSWDHTARLWDAVTGQPLATLKGHMEGVTSAVFSPDGTRVLTVSYYGPTWLWDATTGQPLATLKGHTDKVISAVFSPDGTRVLTASHDTTARLWDAATGQPLATFQGHTGRVNTAVFSPDGTRVLTASDDTTARLWDAATGQPLATLKGHTDKVTSAVFSPDGTRILTASHDTTLLWDATAGQPLATLQGYPIAGSEAFSPDGTRILTTASHDTTARLWDAATGQPLTTLKGHTDSVTSVVFSPDGTRILTASDDTTARLWDTATGQPLGTLQGHTGPVWYAVFSPDGTRILTVSNDATARLWDAATGQPFATLQGPTSEVFRAVFSPEGTRILTAFKETTLLWDATAGQPLATLQGYPIAGSEVFSPDGTRILTASESSTAWLWDAATGQPFATLQGNTGPVNTAVFSPDGTRILTTASDDHTARLWDAATGQPLTTIAAHTREVHRAVFSPDGTRILTTASDDHTARLWDATVPKGNLFEVACTWLPDHNLSDVATEYSFTNLEPICQGEAPLPAPH